MSGVLVLEFNELNLEAVKRMVGCGRLPNFAKLMQAGVVVKTTVEEEYVKLEPWIQWVSAHTGKRQDQHKAFNLSDIQHSNVRQIWEVLDAQGVACGVVSPMNARCGDLKKGFFIPDPWSVSNDTYPASMGPIYRFLAERVQSHNVSLEQGSSKFSFLKACLRAGVPSADLLKLGKAYVAARLNPRRKWTLAAELDRFLMGLTLAMRQRYNTEYTSVFMNAVAHYQHHYWTLHEPAYWAPKYPVLFAQRNPVADRNLGASDDPIAYGLQVYDDIIGRAVDAAGAGSVMILTGLSQVPFEGYEGGTGFYLYRPFDHEKLLDLLGIQCQKIAPLMSRDLMLYFSNDQTRAVAAKTLRETTVMGKPLFHCTEEADSKLFCKVHYTFDVPADAVIVTPHAGGGLRFAEHFQLITFKTGHHSPEGWMIAPLTAFVPGAPVPEVINLEAVPTAVLRVMRMADAEELATDLALSPV